MSKKPKILMVEDEYLVGLLLRRNLQLLGYDLGKVAVTGEEAIRRVEQEQPDIILMDLQLGEVDGIQVAQQIRTQHKTPIIFMTGYSTLSLEQQADELVATTYLVKPVSPVEIKDAIQQLLGK